MLYQGLPNFLCLLLAGCSQLLASQYLVDCLALLEYILFPVEGKHGWLCDWGLAGLGRDAAR